MKNLTVTLVWKIEKVVWKKSGKSLQFCSQKSVRTLTLHVLLFLLVQEQNLHALGNQPWFFLQPWIALLLLMNEVLVFEYSEILF